MARTSARACAMQLEYARLMGGEGGEAELTGLMDLSPEEDDLAYIREAARGLLENADALDAAIAKHLVGWTLNRLARVDLAILRVAAYEIFYRTDVPGPVSVNEAVELSRTYSTPEAGGFINGVLGNLLRAKP